MLTVRSDQGLFHRSLRRSASVARRQWQKIAGRRVFRRDYKSFRRLTRSSSRNLPLNWADRYPCLNDRTATTGFDGIYLLHLAWAARVLANTRPEQHVDISSYIYFPALVSAFIPMKYLEYRPVDLSLSGLTSDRCDLMSLPFEDDSVNSLSCMHVLEHVGLGRYGDPLDAEGDIRACRELQRVLSPGGTLLVAMPVGRPRIAFNAHRIYSFQHVMEMFPGLELVEATLIPDNSSGLVKDATPAEFDSQNYGCGCFWFRKPS